MGWLHAVRMGTFHIHFYLDLVVMITTYRLAALLGQSARPNHVRGPRFTRVLALIVTLTAFGFTTENSQADGPVRLRRSQSQPSWNAGRVDADASAVPTNASRRRVVQTRSRSNLSNQLAQSRQETSQQGSAIRQVGFLDGPGCGPVCDCQACSGGEPFCGLEGPMCGFEGSACGLQGPGCGLEGAGCGLDVACGCDSCSGGYLDSCDGYGCDAACEVDCFPLFLPILRVDWNRFAFFFGTHGFKNAMNSPSVAADQRTGGGSFGFHQGFNEGRNLRPWLGADLAAQFGLRATQSNVHGDAFTNENRNQIFLTGGFFRRVDYGLQYGVVLDYLNEDWYYQTDLLQLRGEVSWKMSACHSFGFHWMAGVSDDTVSTSVTNGAVTFDSQETIEASDQYRAFYRMRFGSVGQWTSFIGGTGDDHFIMGSEVEIPLKANWSMQAGSVYFAPSDDSVIEKHQAEGWNLSMSMVFRPGMNHPANRYRNPMFRVADNGSFFLFR